MLDAELSHLYGVETKRLNEQVKRNIERFPSEFMFQLSEADLKILQSQFIASNADSLRSQIATLNSGRGQHRKYLPYAFTEQTNKKDIYHIGASLKDLGKKWFAFSKLDAASVCILDKLKKEKLL